MVSLEGKTVAIVGLGLMGSSLGLALRPYGVRVIGVEPDGPTRDLALERGIVDVATAELAEGIVSADLVVLAAPVNAIVSLLDELPELCPEGCTVLDLGSTKKAIVAAMDQLPPSFRAVGGHPMCGKETSGPGAADGSLYHEQTFVLCRSRRSDVAAEGLVERLVTAIGATPLWLEPDVHDRLVALVSHLPYFIAATLIAETSAFSGTREHLWQVSASGFRDTTRLAGSDPIMIRDITSTNREEILDALRGYRIRLEKLISLLEQSDDGALLDWIEARQREHSRYREQKQLAGRRPSSDG